MTWNKKNDQFALSCGFYESAQYLARYCLRRGDRNKPSEIEINLANFNSWVSRYRTKGYHRKTLSTTIAWLDEHSQGMIVILKRYSPWIYKVLVRPLAFVERLKSAKCALAPKLNHGNPMFSEDRKKAIALQQQQDISKLDNFLTKVGLKFTPDNLHRIWRMAGKSMAEVGLAVEHMLHAHSTQVKGVETPHGWLVDSLKYGWYKGFNLYYQVELPVFNSATAISDFVRNLSQPAPT